MDLKKIVYLLGAGASQEKIPVVKSLSEDGTSKTFHNDVISELNNVWNARAGTNNSPQLRADIDWLIQEGRKHKSLDTLAKRFYLQDDLLSLKKLKALMSLYFYWKQVPNIYDMRYDSFLATLLIKDSTQLKFQENINLLGWNYDLQFEIALYNYTNKYLLNDIYAQWKIYPGSNNYILGAEIPLLNKLNGTAALYVDDSPNEIHFMNPNIAINKSDRGTIINLLDCYNNLKSNPRCNSLINFAWENNPKSDKSLEYAKKVLIDATHLVVIGYSFPVFNKIIDEILIQHFLYTKDESDEISFGARQLNIYIQDPNAEKISSLLKTRFAPIRQLLSYESEQFEPLKIYTQTDCDQFLTPEDLE